MAAPAITSSEQWAARARALCDAANLKYTAQRLAESEGVEYFDVPTRDRSGSHLVEYTAHTGRVRCSCVAGSYGRPCCHAGTVIYFLAQRAVALSAAGLASQLQYDLFWEGR